MQIKFTTPPCWEEIKEKFKVTEDQHIFYTHGDTIYSPASIMPAADLIRHEETHAEQQEHNDDVGNLWWQRYMRDPEFRILQEVEAYGAQYRFICQKIKDRNQRAKYLHFFAQSLSGPVYDRCIDYAEASKQIRIFADHGRPKLSP